MADRDERNVSPQHGDGSSLFQGRKWQTGEFGGVAVDVITPARKFLRWAGHSCPAGRTGMSGPPEKLPCRGNNIDRDPSKLPGLPFPPLEKTATITMLGRNIPLVPICHPVRECSSSSWRHRPDRLQQFPWRTSLSWCREG